MRPDHIVCVTGDTRVDIPLTAVFDVGVGSVPPALREFFDDSVTIAYVKNERRQTVVLEARAESMETFRTILFRCLLTGKPARVRYPAKRGGHVLDTGYESGRLVIEQNDLTIQRSGGDLSIDLASVTTFSSERERIGDEDCPLIAVGFLEKGTVVSARIMPEDERVLSLLSRYLKLEYTRVRNEVARLDLDEAVLQTLVALDAGATEVEGMVPSVDDADELLDHLQAIALITPHDEGYQLTRRGRIAATTHLESVNS